MLLVVAAIALSPLILGIGLIMLIASFGGDGKGGASFSVGGLKVGNGGVPAQYAPMIEKASQQCGLPAAVLASQINAESSFKPDAQSKDSNGNPIASGIAQFIPSTWEAMAVDGNGDGKKDVWDPADAIATQGKYMCELLEDAKKHPEYSGSPIELALAGYNAGWGAVEHYRGVPPPGFAGGQTYDYVKSIMADVPKFTDTSSTGSTEGAPGDAPEKVRVAIAWALKQKGGWYHLGGDCTNAHGDDQGGWCDCSSLMQQAYKAAGIDLPRVTYDQQNAGKQVDIDHPKPGDLVFNPGSDGSDAMPGHVGMYIGNGQLIEAPRTGVQTRIVPYDSWRNATSPMMRISKVIRIVDW
ncbi:bifunctional lytic transglycosylase/C40 family peptidase [Streptomyces sp. UNOC14_S4]|nr:bifunctional lytic transglycosylase/C40 family peptidase [Streptomyces sp. UNOC14_S4]